MPGTGILSCNFNHQENFTGSLPPDIRHHCIFEFFVIYADRLSVLGKQVHDGSTTQPKCLRGDPEFQDLVPLRPAVTGDGKEKLGAWPKSSSFQLLQSLHLSKKEFFGEGEILLQQAVGREGAPGVRKNALILGEANRFQARRRERDSSIISFAVRIAQDNADTVIEQ